MSARETAELLLLVGRLVQTEGYDGELSPAQLMALRFFACANSFSRTPSAFAEFQATTRGTALQAIKALEDPFEVLVHAADSLGAEVQSVMHHALHDVLTTVAASEAHLHFSVCQDCAYLQNMLRLNKCDRVGPRVPTLQRSDRAGGCSAPLRSFSKKLQTPARCTDRQKVQS